MTIKLLVISIIILIVLAWPVPSRCCYCQQPFRDSTFCWNGSIDWYFNTHTFYLANLMGWFEKCHRNCFWKANPPPPEPTPTLIK